MKIIKCALFLLASPLLAMENTNIAQGTKSPDLIIKNDTTWYINVNYQKNAERLSCTVEPQKERRLTNAQTIRSIIIISNDTFVSKAAGICYPLVVPVEKIRGFLDLYPYWNVCLSISVSVIEHMPIFTAKAYSSTVPHIQHITRIKEIFPRLGQESAKGTTANKIEARYIVEVPQNCSIDSITKAYQEKKASIMELKAQCVKDALELLEAAYKILVQEWELKEHRSQIPTLIHATTWLYPDHASLSVQRKDQMTQELNAKKESFRILIEEKNIL